MMSFVSKSKSHDRNSRRPRRGAILAGALICLFIVLLFAGALVQAVVTQRRQARTHERQPQAMHLADAGLRRAALQLQQSADYAGETWRVPAEQFGGRDAGEVLIQVSPLDAPPRERLVRVEARFPAAGDAPSVVVQEIQLSKIQKIPSSASGENK